MSTPPVFGTIDEYGSRLGDVDFWSPYVTDVLDRHGLRTADLKIEAGFVGTYPTFLHGDVVVKLFGCFPTWRVNYDVECATQALAAANTAIDAPAVIGHGQLFDGDAPWPYLISERVPGTAWRDAGLTIAARHAVAAQLGGQVAALHETRPPAILDHVDWPAQYRGDVVLRHQTWGALPPHLIAQLDEWLAPIAFTRVPVHADLTADHIFVESDQLTGIIDWGDAMVTDRHYELAALHLDLFEADTGLLSTFLKASNWPVSDDFPRRALSFALLHQFNVMQQVCARLPMDRIDTLNALADEVFGI